MSFRPSRRLHGPDPRLLRQLRHEPARSIVDQPPQPWEVAFCAVVVFSMVAISMAMMAL